MYIAYFKIITLNQSINNPNQHIFTIVKEQNNYRKFRNFEITEARHSQKLTCIMQQSNAAKPKNIEKC